MDSILTCNAKESVKEEKLVVLKDVFSGFYVLRKSFMTAVLPVPAGPMNIMGFRRLTWIYNNSLNLVV